MFKFEDLKRIHLEITSNCQASCPMCPRNFHGGIENPNLVLADWSLDDFKFIFNEELLYQLTGFYFCGNFGDPILNDNLIDMVSYAKNINSNIGIRIHTNGGARKIEWWENLANSLPIKHSVHFALDGLEDTQHLYRIGTTYDNVIKNATAFIRAGGKATWTFIRFKHNEHQVEEAQKRAKELGFENFIVKNTTRFTGGVEKFEVFDKKGNLTHYLEPPTGNDLHKNDKIVIDEHEKYINQTKVECMVLDQKEIYIDAFKNVYPCCFLALPTMRKPPEHNHTSPKVLCDQYSQYINEISDTNDASKKSIRDIINGNVWQNINWHKDYWGEEKMFICARTCGKTELVPKISEEFLKTTKKLTI
jgi:hypothetical protein